MITLDEGTLIAYVDGELDTQTVHEVEAALSNDDKARKHVERLRALSALTRIAFNDTLHETVPQHLKDAAMGRTVKGADATDPHVGAANVTNLPRPQGAPRRMMPYGLAAAAAVAGLVLGLGGGVGFNKISANRSLQMAALSIQNDEASMNKTLNKALEVNMSGDAATWINPDTGRSAAFTPVKTYQDKSGKYCREYRKDETSNNTTKTTFGLACRDDTGTWKTRYLIIDDGSGQAL